MKPRLRRLMFALVGLAGILLSLAIIHFHRIMHVVAAITGIVIGLAIIVPLAAT